VDPAPSPGARAVDTGFAARLARDCTVIDQAYRLACWIGENPRPVTAGQVLRRCDVAMAGATLGVEVPQKVRTAADVPALHRPWCVAVGNGLLEVGGGVVAAGPALGRWPLAADGELLAGWLAGLRAVCAAGSGQRCEEDEAAIPALALLNALTLDEPPTGKDLWRAVYSAIASDRYGECYFGTLDRYLDLRTEDPLGGLFTLLRMFGAAAGDSGNPRITPLGRWAAARMHAELPRPADPGLTADELIARLAALDDEDQAWEKAQPWLAARTDTEAARELLAAAAVAAPRLRSMAVELVDGLGEAALPVWQEMADTPGVGPHARAVLASWDRIPALDETSRRWLVVEAAAAALAGPGPDEALSCVYEGIPGPDLGSRIAAVDGSGHPDAEALSRALAEFAASGAPRTVDRVLQLKVTLAGWRPPIWRRVLLPATATLGELHRVIQALFGWDGDHLHAFTVGRKEYSDPSFELEALEMSSEYDLRVSHALTPAARKLIYTYDFGAGWRHEIVLEKESDRQPDQAYPVCVAFKGNSPVEYWSEEDPTEADPFSLAEVNRRLAPARGATPATSEPGYPLPTKQ
jgi:hypothetical protein